MRLRSRTIEYQRFGDPTGVLRPSDRYLRSVGTIEPTQEVSFELPQENLTRAMKLLDYGEFAVRGEAARETAERMLKGLAPFVERFLGDSLPAKGEGRLQIDVVTRALELAQLPFEIVEELRSDLSDLVVTRRIRQPWPPPPVVPGDTPKVLFAWAEPGGKDVPHERHRGLLDDILRDLGGAGELIELPQATRSKLAEALAGEHGFTHLHLLVHGVARVRSADDNPLDLSGKSGPAAVFALQTDRGRLDPCPPDELVRWLAEGAKPQAATIATCHSGEVSPIESGGTIAHILHAAGIPVVLASQLALTKDGSDSLVSVFLKKVLEGEDPRWALRLCRNDLRAKQARTYYDRIALVGYIHVDPGIEGRLQDRRFRIELARLKAISADAKKRVEQATTSFAATKELTDEIRRRFREVRNKLAELEPDRTLSKAQREELRGLQASSLKREAEAAWSLARSLSGDPAREWQELSRDALRAATEAYGRAARVSRDHHWTWVQWLVLRAVQRGAGLADSAVEWAMVEAVSRDVAERQALDDADEKERRDVAEAALWAWGSLCELYLLAPLFGYPNAKDQARDCLRRLVAASRAQNRPDAIEATSDQLGRYKTWWGEDPTWKLPQQVIDDAQELRAELSTMSRGTT